MKDIFPIWLGEFRSKSEYDAQKDSLAAALSVYDWIDDRILFSRHPFSYPAYCSACGCVTQIRIDWRFAAGDNLSPSIHPAWTETGFCENCGLNSRMRAVVDFLRAKINFKNIRRAYIAEQVTPLYRALKHIIPSLVGSEYLGPGYPSGTVHMNWKYLQMIRHEDLTSLSFADGTFDLANFCCEFDSVDKTGFRRYYRPGREQMGRALWMTKPWQFKSSFWQTSGIASREPQWSHPGQARNLNARTPKS